MDTALLAAQLYTIRQHTQTRDDFARSMSKIREIGYRAVQVSAIGAISDADVKQIADDNGLRICNTHIPFDRLQSDLGAVITQHQLWDCRHIAIGSMPAAFRASAEGYRRFAALGSQIGERLAADGMTFSYHNHSFEFVKFAGRAGLEILFDESDPRYLQAELDTYWVQHGGADPVAWIDRLAGRMPVAHLKDMVMLPGEAGEQAQPAMAEVGAGNMNFPAILAACRRAGVEWYAVEQDICQRDPFASLAMSFENLAAMD
ncbi:MAG: sugar phosphate isomerase/epimerase [Chloroflexi bacterium]|nr:sugar phosphate isomerase/epimerase [Chloroflexota bacterium]MCY4246435.1 sugar phosphate isomerase/epimerase [Chloroflexota bacterium]